MIRQAIRSVGLVALALLTLALGMPAWAVGGGSHVRFFHSFGPHGRATFHLGFGHPHVFRHHYHRGFFVLGFARVWVPGQWVWMGNHWQWTPGQWVKLPKGVGVWVPGPWLVLDP